MVCQKEYKDQLRQWWYSALIIYLRLQRLDTLIMSRRKSKKNWVCQACQVAAGVDKTYHKLRKKLVGPKKSQRSVYAEWSSVSWVKFSWCQALVNFSLCWVLW